MLEKFSPKDLEPITKAGLTVVKLDADQQEEKSAKEVIYKVFKLDGDGNEEYSDIYTESELSEMLKILKFI